MAKTDAAGLLVVADAGPLIHLDELDALDVLSDYAQVLALLQDIPKRTTLHVRPSLLAEVIRQAVEVWGAAH